MTDEEIRARVTVVFDAIVHRWEFWLLVAIIAIALM